MFVEMLVAPESKGKEWRANLTEDRTCDGHTGWRTHGAHRMEDTWSTQDGGHRREDPRWRTQDPGDDGYRPWTEDRA